MLNAKRKLKLKNEYNNCFDADEILWLLRGNENLSAFEFVCRKILNIEPQTILSAFEYEDE